MRYDVTMILGGLYSVLTKPVLQGALKSKPGKSDLHSYTSLMEFSDFITLMLLCLVPDSKPNVNIILGSRVKEIKSSIRNLTKYPRN